MGAGMIARRFPRPSSSEPPKPQTVSESSFLKSLLSSEAPAPSLEGTWSRAGLEVGEAAGSFRR